MTATSDLICIACPMGCRILVSRSHGDVVVAGHGCKRGEAYAREETLSPKRIVTAVVFSPSGDPRYVPVKTDKPVPRDRIAHLLKAIYRIKLQPPVSAGTVILKDFEGTGVNVVVTRGSEAQPPSRNPVGHPRRYSSPGS